MAAARFGYQRGLGLDTTDVYPGSHQISRQQTIAAAEYLSRLLDPPHDGRTSLDVRDPGPLLPYLVLGSALIEEFLVNENHAPTLSTPLTQDYDAVTSPVSTTFYQTPGAPQPAPPSWASQTNGSTPPATITPGDPRQCPACQTMFTRWQDCDRHLVTHLPHWIHCPFSNCTWRGNRVKPFKDHWKRGHGGHGNIPEREQFEIFNTQESMGLDIQTASAMIHNAS
ncbi:hypothetical protein EDB87DRAFT_91627 [Lactarius vividus]|nr:hypothetical protein EDB87DRAFT_91627 [Lactarius vividus]